MKIKNDELDKSESESGEIHLSGRKKRKAAGKALQRVSSAIKQFYTGSFLLIRNKSIYILMKNSI